jgi:uncharacterized OB-fold protein
MADPVGIIETPIRLEYDYTPGTAKSRYLRALVDGKILGQRCPSCHKVYVPPTGSCARCGIPTPEEVEVSDTGTVTTFCVVNVPFAGQSVEAPYVSASVLLDGADIPIFALIQEIPADEARMGMRVKAVWAPAGERKPSSDSIRHFVPSGEPDVSAEKLLGWRDA